MSKPGAHKKKYDAYKNSGRKEINKKERAAKNQRRIDRFAKRKEEGKAYEYSKDHSAAKLKEAYGNRFDDVPNKDDLVHDLFKANQGSNRGTRTDLARWTSGMRKLDNELAKIKADAKKEAEKAKTEP